MSTTTSRLGLTKPDGPEDILVSVLNGNFNKIDAGIDTVCTASTRPSAPFLGQQCYETDTTGFIVCTQVTPSVVWRYLNAGTAASVTARNALTPTREGMPVFRSDKNWVEEFIATAWRIRTIPLVASFSDITDPATGQLIIYTPDLTVRRYNGTAWVILTPFGGADNAAASASGIWSSTSTATTFTAATNICVPFATAVRRCPTYVTPDANFRIFTLVKAGDYTISASVRASNVNNHELSLIQGAFVDGNSLPGGYIVMKQDSGPGSANVAVSQFFAAGTQICAVVYNRGAGNSTGSSFSRATSLDIKYHGGEV